MRICLFFFIILLYSCSASPSSQETQDPSGEDPNSLASQSNGNENNGETVVYKLPDPIKGGPADISFNIEGLTAGFYKIIGFYAEGHFLADSVQANNKGQIRIKKSDGYVQGLYYLSLGNNQYLQFLLGEDQKFEVQVNPVDVVNTIKIKGSDENEKYYESLKFENDFSSRHKSIVTKLANYQDGTLEHRELFKKKTILEQERQDYLDKLYNEYPDLLFTKFKKAGQNPKVRNELPDDTKVYYFRKEFWDNVDFNDSRLIRTPVIFNKLKRYITELTAQNQDSIFSSSRMLIEKSLAYPEYFKFFANWIVIQYEPAKCTLMDPEAVFVNMARNYFTRDRAFWSDSMEVYAIQNRANEMGQSLLGQKGPNVISTGPDGSTEELYKHTADYLIVYMFNPTCEHCMEQTPKLVKWYNENKNKDIDVFAIALDTDEEEWKAYIEKSNMNFTNVFDPSNRSIYAKYYVDVTPEVYVLNKEGTIIAKNLKINQIDIMIERDRAKRK